MNQVLCEKPTETLSREVWHHEGSQDGGIRRVVLVGVD